MRTVSRDDFCRSNLRNPSRKILSVAVLACVMGSSTAVAAPKQNQESQSQVTDYNLDVSPDYCSSTFSEVDKTVKKELYSPRIAKEVWPKLKEESRNAVHGSKTLIELDNAINTAIKGMHQSHCQFVTTNDETYYFLHALFGHFKRGYKYNRMDYTGVVCGGVGLPLNQVRYVLNDSPGARAGVRVGDTISSVNGAPYVGQSNFFKTSGKQVSLSVERQGKHLDLSVHPKFENPFKMYVDASASSAKVIETPEGPIGYMRLWAGGDEFGYALESALSKQLHKTNGLILDLRDGYGGNSLPELDVFYRDPAGYPTFIMTDRKGAKTVNNEFYDKPVVVLINGGSRSGKELLAYSFQHSGRAKLVGTKTAGFVLGGRLFKINDRASLYLAVADCEIDGKRLEGNGVDPDVVVSNPQYTADGDQAQLDKAREILLEEIKTKKSSSSKLDRD